MVSDGTVRAPRARSMAAASSLLTISFSVKGTPRCTSSWRAASQGGQSAAGAQANAATNAAAGVSNAYGNIGNAQAAGAIGVGNALSGTINNGLSLWQYQRGVGGNSGGTGSMGLPRPF